jgi:hypothetical protein
MFEWLIYFWVGYGGFSFLYFGVDYFGKYSRGETVRELCGRIATVLLYLYPAFVAFVALSAEGSFFIPSWAQTPYWAVADWAFGMLVIKSLETVIGTKIVGRNTIVTRALVHSLVLVEYGMTSEGGFLRYQRLKLLAKLTGRPVQVELHASEKNVRPEVLSLLGVIGAISTAVTWRFTDIRGLDLLAILDLVFLGFMVFSGVLGWSKRRRDSNRKNIELRVPKYLWSRFRVQCLMRLLSWLSHSQIKST